MLEVRFVRPEFQPLGHFAEFGLLAGAHHQCRGCAAHRMGSHPERIGPLTQGCLRWQQGRRLFHRECFPREHGFVDEQIFGFQNQPVAGNDIAGVQDDDIARHDLFDRHFPGASITQNRRFDPHDGKEFLHGVRGAALLPEPEQAADEDDKQNDAGVDSVTQEQRQSRCDEQDEYDRTCELIEQERPHIRPLGGPESIGAIAREPRSGFIAGQSLGCRLKVLEHLSRGSAPKSRRELVHPGIRCREECPRDGRADAMGMRPPRRH